MKQRKRLVFANIVREPAFAWLAGELGWVPAAEPQQYAQSQERTWNLPGNGMSVTYVDDKLLDMQYLIVDGTADQVKSIRESVGPRAPLHDLDSVRALLNPASGSFDPVLGIYAAALIAPKETDQEILSWFRDGMSHSHPLARQAAYFATAYPGWREFEPLLVEASNEDPDSESRELAARALASLRKNVWRTN